MINLTLITGVSGAGKTEVLSVFEENGYYVIDNIPLPLVKNLINIVKAHPKKYTKIALAIPPYYADEAYKLLSKNKEFNILFLGLDCATETLRERFRLSRRLHPLQPMGVTLNECIALDKKSMFSLHEKFTHYIDTSKLSSSQLRKQLYSTIFINDDNKLSVTFVSFGYKKSIPLDVDIVIDTRVLPNPYWVDDLKDMTGLDKPVVDYIFNSDITKKYIEEITKFLDYVLESAKQVNRRSYAVGVACTGGQHRSVAVAEYLRKYYSKKYNTSISHRELGI